MNWRHLRDVKPTSPNPKLDEETTVRQLKHIIRDAQRLGIVIDYDAIITKRDAGKVIQTIKALDELQENLQKYKIKT